MGGFHTWVEQSSATTTATGPATTTGPASTRAPSDSAASAVMAAVSMMVVMASVVEPWPPVPWSIVVIRITVVPTTARREIYAISSYIESGQYKDHNQEDELYNPTEKQDEASR